MPSRHFTTRTTATSLTDTVANTVRQMLIQGELRAGQRLSEAALSQQLDISRNTLREVFRILIKEGLLHHEPNRGVSVVVPSIADIIDIYRVRRLIECQSLEKAWPLHRPQAHARCRSQCPAGPRCQGLAQRGLSQHGLPCRHRGAQRQ